MTIFKVRRVAGFLFVLFLCFGGVWIYRLIWGKPSSFHVFAARVMAKRAFADPEFLTYLGITDNTYLDFTSDKLTDISLPKNSIYLQQVRESLDVLHQYRKEDLTAQEQLTYDVLEYDLQRLLDDASFGSYLHSFWLSYFTPYPVNQVFGLQSCLVDFMVNIHRVVNEKSAAHYIARLSQWDKKFADLIEELKRREERGIIPPRFVIEKLLHELTQFISVSYSDNLLYTSFQSKLQNLQLTASSKEALEKKALHAMETKVYPAYLRMLAFLQKQMEKATTDAGVWKFPMGKEFYIQCLRYHTTTDDSPDNVHAFGLSEVKRIQGELRELLDQLGHQGQDVLAAMKALSADPRFFYPETDEGRKQVLDGYRKIFREAQPKLSSLFFHTPKRELRVEAVPDFREKTSPMAYYEPGDLRGHRSGVFYVNTYNVKAHPKFAMASLAYHEGIPGHHLQIELALENKQLPLFRKVASFNAYIEGWALYCERLAFEYGWTTDLYSNVGRLQFELMRAVRLVVDTGLHWKRWSREEAMAYMAENTGMDEEEVEVEIERYVVMPAQACSYKIGMREILQLREEMKERLGDRFDIKTFHQMVLQNGALPLVLLRNQFKDPAAGKN